MRFRQTRRMQVVKNFLPLIVSMAVTAHAQSIRADDDAGVRFSIREFQLEGNTLLDSPRLLAELAPLVGTDRSLDTLIEARDRVRAAYQAAGRPLVAVGLPRTFGDDGVLRLRVVEIPVRAVRVSGNARLGRDAVRARLPALREDESPAMDELGRQLALANDNPSLSMRVEFAPRDDLAADAQVEVTEREPLVASIAVDNTGTLATGRWRLGVSVTHNDLLGYGDIAALSYTTAPENPNRVHQAALSYRWPLARYGDALMVSGSYSDVDSGRVNEVFDVAGRGSSFALRYQHNLVRTLARRHTLELGADRRRYRSVISFAGVDLGGDLVSRPVTLAYAGSGQRDGYQWGSSLSVARNLPGGVRNDDAAYQQARFGAPASWEVWRFGARLQAPVPGGIVAALNGEGQYSHAPLVSGEQFGLGGARSVRGFEERAVTGDRGWRIGFELLSPPLGAWGRLALFSDRGALHRVQVLPGELADAAIAAWGLGWRMQASAYAWSVDWAEVRDEAPGTSRGDQRIHVSAVIHFQ